MCGAILRVLHCVNLLLDILCPLHGRLRLVKRLPRDGFSDTHGEGVVLIFKHLISKEEHGNVKLDAQSLTDICESVKEVGISAFKIDGNDIALCFYAFRDEGFLPFQVTNHTVRSARAKSGGKHDNVIIAGESCLNNGGEVSALLACFVNGDEKWRQSVEVHQEVVD